MEMTEDEARLVKSGALAAVRELNAIVSLIREMGSDLSDDLRRGIGLSICQIDVEVVSRVYREFPGLDDLRDNP